MSAVKTIYGPRKAQRNHAACVGWFHPFPGLFALFWKSAAVRVLHNDDSLEGVMGRALILFTIAAASAIPAMAELPPEIAERIEAAEQFLETDSFVGKYTITNTSVVRKTDGTDPKEVEVVIDVVHGNGGRRQSRLVRMVEDGEDVTEKRRKKIQKQMDRQQAGERDRDDQDLIDPFGEHSDRFVFGPHLKTGNIVKMSFNPKNEHSEDERISTGTVAWDNETLDPVWAEMTAIKPPKPLKELTIRLEFSRLGDDIYVSKFLTNGLVKVLLIKRRFEAEIVFSNLKPTR